MKTEEKNLNLIIIATLSLSVLILLIVITLNPTRYLESQSDICLGHCIGTYHDINLSYLQKDESNFGYDTCKVVNSVEDCLRYCNIE